MLCFPMALVISLMMHSSSHSIDVIYVLLAVDLHQPRRMVEVHG